MPVKSAAALQAGREHCGLLRRVSMSVGRVLLRVPGLFSGSSPVSGTSAESKKYADEAYKPLDERLLALGGTDNR